MGFRRRSLSSFRARTSCPRALENCDIEITVAGPIGISEDAVAQAPANVNVTFTVPVPRDRVSALCRAADVFVLPTLSDGFGMTQVEATGHGCPVAATPNCGRVVTDGEDGFIITPRDAEALADGLLILSRNRRRLHQMARATQETAQKYTLDAYARRLFTAVHAAIESPEQTDTDR